MRPAVGIDLEGDFDVQVAAPLGIARTDQVGCENARAGGLWSNHLFAFTCGDRVARGIKRGGSKAPAQVGDPHAREHLAAHAIGRIGTRTAQDRRALAGGREHFPDRHAPAQVDGLGGQKGVLLLVAVQGQLGQVILGIAAQEIEDAMTARIGARGKCGPCHGSLGGSRGGDACEPPLLFEPRQIGKLA